jgi:hypothetical protein
VSPTPVFAATMTSTSNAPVGACRLAL